jgi:hypothetical protein
LFIRLTEGRFLLLNRVIHFMLPQIQPLALTYSFIYVIQRTLAGRQNRDRWLVSTRLLLQSWFIRAKWHFIGRGLAEGFCTDQAAKLR